MAYNPFEAHFQSTASNAHVATSEVVSSTDGATATSPKVKVIELLKKAIDFKTTGVVFHNTCSRYCHMWGLQGFKRWNRVQMNEDFDSMNHLQHELIDLFGVNYGAENMQFEAPVMTNLKEFLKQYREYEAWVYQGLSKIANELCDLGYNYESCMIDELGKGSVEEIKKIRRWEEDFSKADYQWAYVRVVDDRLHTKMKAVEK